MGSFPQNPLFLRALGSVDGRRQQLVWLPPDFRAVFVERLTVRREQRLPPSRKVAAPTGRAQFHGSGSMPSQRAAEQGRSNAHHRTRFLCRVGVLNRQSGVLHVG